MDRHQHELAVYQDTGRSLMSNFAATPTNLTDTLDYLLSGYNSLGNEFVGKNSQTFVYLSLQQIPPYVQDTQPTFLLPPDGQYIETDMWVPITITDARQSVAVGMQMRPWIGYNVVDGTGFATMDIFLSLNRYKAGQKLFFPTTVLERRIVLESDTSNPVNGEVITTGTSALVFQPVIDTPGEIGDYIYWQEIYLSPQSSNPRIEAVWLGVDDRSISASMVKP